VPTGIFIVVAGKRKTFVGMRTTLVGMRTKFAGMRMPATAAAFAMKLSSDRIARRPIAMNCATH
jgi:hypothetical protein